MGEAVAQGEGPGALVVADLVSGNHQAMMAHCQEMEGMGPASTAAPAATRSR